MDRRPEEWFLEACGLSGPLSLDLDGQGGADSRTFGQPFVVVGRDPEADVVLDDARVSRRHAYLQAIAGRVFCADLGSRTGVLWEEGPRPSGWVDRRLGVRIGPFWVRAGGDAGPADLEDPLAARALGGSPLPAVTLEFPRTAEQPPWRVSRVLTLAGRAPGCRLRLEDPAVSKYHFSLLRTPAGVWVVDLLGRGGILVNGRRVRWGRLEHGATLQVGPFLILVRCTTSPADPPVPGTEVVVAVPRVAPRPGRLALPAAAHGGPAGGLGLPPPDRLPAPGPAAGPPVPAVPPGAPAPPTAELYEPVLAQMADQFGRMQQQMFDQFQQAMIMMAQMFGTLQRDQMGLIRDELDQLRRLNQDLQALQAELPPPSPAASPPAGLTPGDTATAEALARIEALLLASQTRPDAPPTEGGSAGAWPADRVPGRASPPPPPGQGGHAPPGDRTTAAVRQAPAEGAAGPPPAPAGVPGAYRPEGQPDENIHTLLYQKIAAIQRERQSRWQRILDLMLGR